MSEAINEKPFERLTEEELKQFSTLIVRGEENLKDFNNYKIISRDGIDFLIIYPKEDKPTDDD